jgi:hypothetical protein
MPGAARPEFLRLPVWNDALRSAVAGVNSEVRRSDLPDHARLIDLSAALSGATTDVCRTNFASTLHRPTPVL